MWLFGLCYYLIGLLSDRCWLGGLVVVGVAWFVCLILTSCSCCLDLVVLLVKVVLEWSFGGVLFVVRLLFDYVIGC